MRHVAFVRSDFTRIQTPLLGNHPSASVTPCQPATRPWRPGPGAALPQRHEKPRIGKSGDGSKLHPSCRKDSQLGHM